MRVIILAFFVLASMLHASTDVLNLPLYQIQGRCDSPKHFSKSQKKVLLYAFKYGIKSGFAYTLAAIAWKESCAGEYRINFSDPSAGIYHALIPGILKKHNKKDTPFMRNLVGELLIRDDNFASKMALDELMYWKKIRGNDWEEIVKSYNKGFSWEENNDRSAFAQEYYNDITKKVKVLQSYLPFLVPNLAKMANKNDMALKSIKEKKLFKQNEEPTLKDK